MAHTAARLHDGRHKAPPQPCAFTTSRPAAFGRCSWRLGGGGNAAEGGDHSSHHAPPNRKVGERQRGRASDRGTSVACPLIQHPRGWRPRLDARVRARAQSRQAVHCGHATPPPRTWLRRGGVFPPYISVPRPGGVGAPRPSSSDAPPALVGHSAARSLVDNERAVSALTGVGSPDAGGFGAQRPREGTMLLFCPVIKRTFPVSCAMQARGPEPPRRITRIKRRIT